MVGAPPGGLGHSISTLQTITSHRSRRGAQAWLPIGLRDSGPVARQRDFLDTGAPRQNTGSASIQARVGMLQFGRTAKTRAWFSRA